MDIQKPTFQVQVIITITAAATVGVSQWQAARLTYTVIVMDTVQSVV